MQGSGKISSSCPISHRVAKLSPIAAGPVRTRRRGGVSILDPWNSALMTRISTRPALVQAQQPDSQGPSTHGTSDGSSSTAVLTMAARIDTGEAIEELQVC
jgi:hypothetical protein